MLQPCNQISWLDNKTAFLTCSSSSTSWWLSRATFRIFINNSWAIKVIFLHCSSSNKCLELNLVILVCRLISTLYIYCNNPRLQFSNKRSRVCQICWQHKGSSHNNNHPQLSKSRNCYLLLISTVTRDQMKPLSSLLAISLIINTHQNPHSVTASIWAHGSKENMDRENWLRQGSYFSRAIQVCWDSSSLIGSHQNFEQQGASEWQPYYAHLLLYLLLWLGAYYFKLNFWTIVQLNIPNFEKSILGASRYEIPILSCCFAAIFLRACTFIVLSDF